MTDKVQKIREKVVEMVNSINPFIPDEDGKNSDYEAGKLDATTQILQIIDSFEEPVSEDLEDTTQTITYNGEVYTRCYKDKLDAFACKYPMSVPKPSKRYAKYSNVDLTIAVKEGANWQKKHLWKPADGDELPIINREVIALLDNGKVVFAHRPTEYWDGKDIVTGKVTRNYPKTYDKGGWNIPNVKYWLDVELPKE